MHPLTKGFLCFKKSEKMKEKQQKCAVTYKLLQSGLQILSVSCLLNITWKKVSVGYFLADLGMIVWFYPALGGMEYVIHHLLSIGATACAMLTGEAQFYTYMVLISETTTPGINLRWYLDKAGMKRSRAYLINGVLMFLAWLVVRILFFMYIFYHIYLHVDQVKQCRTCVQILVFSVPVVLFIMNAVWFSKIVKGLVKTLAKQQ